MARKLSKKVEATTVVSAPVQAKAPEVKSENSACMHGENCTCCN